MAKQCGRFKITGTVEGICFYRMHGNYYGRVKSSLTRKRVMKDPAFRLTRKHAALLGEASKIASALYRQITGEEKKHTLYRELTGKAMQLLREGKDKEAVFQILCRFYLMREVEEEITEDVQKKNIKSEKEVLVFGDIHNPVPELKMIFLKSVRRRKYFRSGFSREMGNDWGRKESVYKKTL